MTEAERHRTINANMGLVNVVAAEYRGGSVEFEDLCQIGAIGLTKAVDSFNPTAGKTFANWAADCIRSELDNATRPARPKQADWFPKKEDSELAALDGNKFERIYEWDAWGDRGNAEAICERWSYLGSSPEELSILYGDIKEKRAKFEAAFISLSVPQRKLVTFVFLNERPMPVTQAASELGISYFQATRMLKRALKVMREVITRMESKRPNSGGNANGHPSNVGLHGSVSGASARVS